jgi:hypothetical protein
MATFSQAQYDQLKKQKAFAWAKYYEEAGNQANIAGTTYRMLEASGFDRSLNGTLVKPDTLPPHITQEFMEMAERLNAEYTCPCCFDLVSKETIHLTWCGHILCKGCYDKLKERAGRNKPNCPHCRKSI